MVTFPPIFNNPALKLNVVKAVGVNMLIRPVIDVIAGKLTVVNDTHVGLKLPVTVASTGSDNVVNDAYVPPNPPVAVRAGKLKFVRTGKVHAIEPVTVARLGADNAVNEAMLVDHAAPREVNAGNDNVVSTGAIELKAPVIVVKFVRVKVVTDGIEVLNAPPTVSNVGILIVVMAFKALIVNAPVIEVNAGRLNVTSACSPGVNAPEQVV